MQGRSNSFGWTLAFEFAPAAIFGSATAFAASKALVLPQAHPAPLAIGFGSFCASWLLLRLFRGKPDDYVMPMFDLGAFDRELAAAAEAATEVPLLPEARRPEQEPEPEEPTDELVLDDILVAIDPAARVVSLFQANDTAGELHARIERHLRDAPRPSGPPDATQELHEAIAALRRSLR